MAAVVNAAQYTHYLPMVDDSADDLEAQLHQELYGEDTSFAAESAGQDKQNPGEQNEVDEADGDEEDEEQEQNNELHGAAQDGEQNENNTAPEGNGVFGPTDDVEDVTGYDERDATLLEEDDPAAEATEDAPASSTNDAHITASGDARDAVQSEVLRSTSAMDVYEPNTPASMVFADEPSEPPPMLIVLPGSDETYPLCSSEERAVLAGRKDLYGKTVAELFAALRQEPLLRERFTSDWKEMLLCIPELQLVLHEDDGYTAQVHLEDLALVHQAFCAPPVKFTLSEQYRFEYRFQAYQAEIQRRLDAGENITSTEPFDPEIVTVVPALPETATGVASAPVGETHHEMEDDENDENGEGQDDATPQVPAAQLEETVQEGAHPGGAVIEGYDYDLEGDPEDDQDQDPESVENGNVDAHGQVADADTVHDECAASGAAQAEEGEEGEEYDGGEGDEYVHVEIAEVAAAHDRAADVSDEPQQEGIATNSVEVQHVEIQHVQYEYVDEDGNVLVEGYDSITSHPSAAQDSTALVNGALSGMFPHNDSTAAPSESTAAQDAEAPPVDDMDDIPEDEGVDPTFEDEYHEPDHESAFQPSGDSHDPEHHEGRPAEYEEEADDERVIDGAIGEDASETALVNDAVSGASPTSVSGVKRAREEDLDGGEDLLDGEELPDIKKRARVA